MRLFGALLIALSFTLSSGPIPAGAAAVDVNGLRLPAGSFSPATPSGPTVVVNHDADHGYFSWLHSASYTHFHRVTGMGEDAQWKPAGGTSHVVEFLYLGSIFAGTADAANAYADASTYPVNQYAAARQPCPRGLPRQCTRLKIAITSAPTSTQWHDTFTVGPCLVETMADRPTTLRAATGVKTQTLATLASIDRAALLAAQKACLPASGPFGFTLTHLSIANVQGRAQSTFKAGQPFVISAEWSVRNLKGTATANVTLTYQIPSGSSWTTKATGKDQVVTVKGINPFKKQVGLNTPGRYRIVMSVTIRSLSRQGTAFVTITR